MGSTIYDAKKTRILNWQAWQHLGFDNGSKIEDRLFVDNEGHNYQLREESPANELGFKPIPIEKIGCYKSDERPTWPIIKKTPAEQKIHELYTIDLSS